MNKKFEILAGFPPYGCEEMTSVGDQEFYSEGFIVRFFKEDGQSWIANFRRGINSFDRVYEYPDDKILVFAGGKAYIMNPNEKRPIENFGYGFRVVECEERQLACFDFSSVIVVESDLSRWEIKTSIFDRFSQFHFAKGQVHGVGFNIYGQKDQPFTLDLKARELTFTYNGKPMKYTPYRPLREDEKAS